MCAEAEIIVVCVESVLSLGSSTCFPLGLHDELLIFYQILFAAHRSVTHA